MHPIGKQRPFPHKLLSAVYSFAVPHFAKYAALAAESVQAVAVMTSTMRCGA